MRLHVHPGLVALLGSMLPAQRQDAPPFEAGTLFEAVAATLARSYYDRAFRDGELPLLVESYREAARAADDLAEERVVIDALLRHVPASHLALLSTATHRRMLAELARDELPTFGVEIERRAGRFFVADLYAGGPAALAGVRRGDRVVAVDGRVPGASPRLDRSSDDAHLPDPPRHQLLGVDGDRVRLSLERSPGAEPLEVTVDCVPYSAWRAAEASVQTFDVEGQRIGYVRYWYVHIGGVHRHFGRLLQEDFATCGAVVLDLRGRGGDGSAVEPLVRAVQAARKPVVALVDRTARSAKEVIAYRLRQEGTATLVGEHTARAVIPATFKRVGKDDVLMFPSFALGKYTEAIEHVGVAPHVAVGDELPWAAGADRILEVGLGEAARLAAAPPAAATRDG
jgi:carboxyl-terminal processing protease